MCPRPHGGSQAVTKRLQASCKFGLGPRVGAVGAAAVGIIAAAVGKSVTTVVSRFCTAATAMAATTAVLMICVLPPALEARRPYVKRSGRPRRREAFVYAADNRTRPAAEAPLFRFALVGDTHYWMPTDRRAAFLRMADSRATRDGLLVGDSPAVLQVVLGQLSAFARGGGQFAVHTGDSVCAGSSFEMPRTEYEHALRRVAELERAALGDWPVHHIPGNHDVDNNGRVTTLTAVTPNLQGVMAYVGGGLGAWRNTLGNRTATPGRVSPSGHSVLGKHGRHGELFGSDNSLIRPSGMNYGSLRRAGWRLLLLDSMDGLTSDSDGHGHIGPAQLRWMGVQLTAAAEAGENVALISHQLLVEPITPGAAGTLPAFLNLQQDFVDNRHEVLRLLKKHPHVRLSLHAHVHANTLTMRHGIVFVSSASASEYPMQWREVQMLPCEVRLRTRPLHLPLLLDKSARRESRGANVNEAKVRRQPSP